MSGLQRIQIVRIIKCMQTDLVHLLTMQTGAEAAFVSLKGSTF